MDSLAQSFDSDGFYAAIVATVEARNLTWKQVALQTGVSATTLARMAQGRKPDASSLAALSAWAGINPADFVPGNVTRAPEPLAQISTLLRRDRRLGADAAKALDVMIRTAYAQLREPTEPLEGKNKPKS